MIPVVACAMLFVACSEEKTEPLPKLPEVEIPQEITGLYTGRLPCDDCKTKMVRINLKDDRTAEVVETRVKDTLVTDTLKGSYEVADSLIQVSIDKVHWKFKRIKFGNLAFLAGNGKPYLDENGMSVELVHIFKAPARSKTATQSQANPTPASKTDSVEGK